MKNTSFYSTLFLGIFSFFLACNGQSNENDSRKATPLIELGRLVSNLDPTIWSIHQDRNHNFWFGSKENGVYFFDGKTMRNYTKEDGLVSNEIRGIQEDSAGNLFLETVAGVSKFDGHKFETLKIKERGIVSPEWKLMPGDLWFRIGFQNPGPYRYDGEYLYNLKFPQAPYEEEILRKSVGTSFSPYGIYSIYRDKNGSMWFGTAGMGLCQFDGASFNWHYEEQLQTTNGGGDFGMRAILQDQEGYFWFNNSRYRYDVLLNRGDRYLVFNKKDGMGYLDENKKTQYPFFLSIAQDNENNLWMVTYNNGVWKNNGKALLHYPIKDGEIDVLLFSIFKDNQGTLWLGTHNAGVYKFNGQSFEKFKF